MTHENAPVINPADLAAIIAKSHTGGFSPSVPQRPSAGIVAGNGFMPANFETIAKQNPPPQTAGQSAGQSAGQEPEVAKAPVLTVVSHPRPEPKPERDFAAELAAAFEKGRASGLADGKAQGQAEAAAQLQERGTAEMTRARDAFVAAAKALAAPQDDLADSLCSGIEAAILRLASERAGMAIAENPSAFLRRIEGLADRVSQGLRQVRVSLNPDDLALINAHLGDHPIDMLEFSPRPGLSHGDVIVTAQGITLSDLLVADTGVPA